MVTPVNSNYIIVDHKENNEKPKAKLTAIQERILAEIEKLKKENSNSRLYDQTPVDSGADTEPMSESSDNEAGEAIGESIKEEPPKTKPPEKREWVLRSGKIVNFDPKLK